MKHFYIIMVSVLLLSCSSEQTESRFKHQQYRFLTETFKESLNNLKTSVDGSGYRMDGAQFYKSALKIRDKIDTITSVIEDNNTELAKKLVLELIEISEQSLDTLKSNSNFIISSLNDLDESNSALFLNSLLLFSNNVIHKYHNKFNRSFLKYDLVDIMVIPDHQNNANTKSYEADVFLRAGRSTMNPKYEYDIVGDDEGFLPMKSNDYGIGKLEIYNLPIGQNKCIIRITEIHDNQEMEFEETVTIESK